MTPILLIIHLPFSSHRHFNFYSTYPLPLYAERVRLGLVWPDADALPSSFPQVLLILYHTLFILLGVHTLAY